MNRLQKKCVLVSTGFHLLLLVILFVGPAFLSSRDRSDDMEVLDFIPMKTIDALLSGGGNPTATPPPPAPQPQPQAPQPQAAPPPPQPQPVREAVRSPEPSLEPVVKKRSLPDVSTEIVKRPRTTSSKASSSDSDAKSRADARREAISSALRNLRGGLSSSTKIEMPGPGGGGPTYANFLQAVKSIYANAWAGTVPDGATEQSTSVTVSVTIARDGAVLSARIVRSSGKPLVDKSVQSVLDRVRRAVPIPEDSKDKERTVEITFEVNPRNLAG